MSAKLLKRIISWIMILTLALGCLAQAEDVDTYVHFVCNPDATTLSVVSLEAQYEDELSVKAKKALLADWDGVSATLGEGDLTYHVVQHDHMEGMVHAFDLAEGVYFVKASALGYTPISWTAVNVRYNGGVMQMKLNLTPASQAPQKPAATAEPELPNAMDTLTKDDPAAPQRVTFWCDPAGMQLTVRQAEGAEETVAPLSVRGAGTGASRDLVAVAEYVYLLADGDYVYSAKCEGYLPQEGIPFTVSGEDMMIDLTLKSEIRSVKLSIIAPMGETVTALRSVTDDHSISANESGAYRIAPGYYLCTTINEAGEEKTYNVTVKGDQPEQVYVLEPISLLERATQAVAFELWQEGTILTVYAFDEDGEKVVFEAGEDGLYRLPVGTVWYDASAEGHIAIEGQPVQVETADEQQKVRVWLLSEARTRVNRTKNAVIFAAIANKNGAQPFSEELQTLLDELGLVRADYFYSTKRSDGQYESVYYGTLEEDNVWFAVDLLSSSDEIAFAEPEYLYFTTAIDNPWYTGDQAYLSEQTWLEPQGVRAIWGDLENQGITPGEGVVVAVIDTGVDYTHPDLKSNIWTNWMELDGAEGVDDDGNGYVDDVYGWNFVSENNNVKDDHGHGTHVAGIIAMADNGTGGVGIAYGSKVMAIKAGQASGTFSSSAIARAVMYAQACGADIINMSFGGYSESTIVENALRAAYTDCLLVAAAGNDGLPTTDTAVALPRADMYPAGYTYVLGVMATDDGGSVLAGFSNWDGGPGGTGGEYELSAPGMNIYSTLPGDRYARWSGTSMAAPVVSGAAAVMMSTGKSGSRYVTGQLVGASKKCAVNVHGFSFVSFDLASSLNSTPIPELKLLEVVAFDDPVFDGGAVNNGDGVFQNGETIELGIAVRNRWGAAVDVQIEASSLVNEIDPGFITWVDNTAVIDSVGTFADADTGFVYNDGELVSVTDPLRFVIGKDVAHNVEIPITFTVTAKNGMDDADSTAYAWGKEDGFTYEVTVENGEVISGILTEDTTLTADRLWIIRGSVKVPDGVTLTVEAGTHVHFEQLHTGDTVVDDTYYPFLQVLGAADFAGTQMKPINVTTDSRLAVLGPTESDAETANDAYYNNTLYYSPKNCIMRYVYVDGHTKIVDGMGWAHGSVLLLTHGSHLEVVDCAVAGKLEKSKFQACVFHRVSTFHEHTLELNECDVRESMWCYNGHHSKSDFQNTVLHGDNITAAAINDGIFSIFYDGSILTNNAVLNKLNQPADWFRMRATENTALTMSGNFWGTDNPAVISDIIIDSNDIVSYGTITYEPFLTKSSDMSSIYPFVVDAWITDADGNRIEDVIGAQEVTFHVLFNRDMNTNDDLTVAYGPAEPYNDYHVNGEWKSARKWEGTYQVNPVIDYGTMYIYVAGGHAADDYWLETAPDSRHWFEISNAGAEALVLQSWAESDGIHLTWTQDDFETLAGYNLYRTQTLGDVYDESGQYIGIGPMYYQKINPVLIPADTLSYVDADVIEGETYYYYFTVVQTDFAESDGSNVTTCTALDMTKPVINHTQIASILTGQSLSVSAEVTDNVKVDSVTLHTRVQGGSWTDTKMVNTNGSLWYANLVVNGTKPIEYYISATDGVGTASWKSANAPAVVVVESPEFTLGDLNADGTVDIVDLMTVTQSIVGTKTLTVTQAKAADVNADGTVDVFDLMKIAQRICGMIGSL